MLAALVITIALQAVEPTAPVVATKPPAPPVDTEALAMRLELEFAGQELLLLADLRRNSRNDKRPTCTVSAEGVRYQGSGAPRAHRAGERVRIQDFRRERDGILLRVGPPGFAAERLMPGGDTDSSVRLPPPPQREVTDTYDLFEKSARYADHEATKQRAAKARVVTILLEGSSEEDYRAALGRLFALNGRPRAPSPPAER